jgi:quercetin dioxygenase-like cupin family protein
MMHVLDSHALPCSRPLLVVCGANPKEIAMPFYQLDELEKKPSPTNTHVEAGAVPGEFMKFGIVTKPEGEGPPLHEHPNEEQFTVILSGQMHFVLGNEDRVVGPGTLIHIPRNTRHRSRPVNGSATFITVKSPCGNGELTQDYHMRPEAKEIEALYPGNN